MRGLGVCVAPWIPAGQAGGGIEPGRLLPFGLCRQPAPGPPGVRVGLVPAHVQHGLVRRDRLLPAEHPAGPLPAVPPPVQRRGQRGPLPVLPASPGPPARVVIPAIRDELGVGAAGHRGGVEVVGRYLHGVRGALVVQRPGLGRSTHGERPAGHEHLGRQAERVGGRRPGGGGGEHRRSGPDLVGDQHRLVVLRLVLGDHPEREPVAEQPPPGERGSVEQVEDAAAHLVAVGPRLRPAAAGAESGVRPAGARTRRTAGRSRGAAARGRRPREAARVLLRWRCARGPRPAGTSAASAV